MTTMRRVRVQIGPRFRHYVPGEVVELADDEAAKLIESGLATVLPDEPTAAGAADPADEPVETTDLAPNGDESDKPPVDAPDEPGSSRASEKPTTTQRTKKPRARRPAST